MLEKICSWENDIVWELKCKCSQTLGPIQHALMYFHHKKAYVSLSFKPSSGKIVIPILRRQWRSSVQLSVIQPNTDGEEVLMSSGGYKTTQRSRGLVIQNPVRYRNRLQNVQRTKVHPGRWIFTVNWSCRQHLPYRAEPQVFQVNMTSLIEIMSSWRSSSWIQTMRTHRSTQAVSYHFRLHCSTKAY